MKELNSQMVKDFALSAGLDLVGVANIERFANAPRSMYPSQIMPRCRSVIVVARRNLRGNWRGIEEGTYWPGYTYFGYHGLLNTQFIPQPLYETACFIEDFGWEAVPYYPGVPERQSPQPPLREGQASSDVHLSIRLAGVAAGLGEMGWSKVFLTKRFGPRVRLHAIFTDAVLEPDPLVEPGSLCNRCGACVSGCSARAIPPVKGGKTLRVQIEDKTYEWGDVQMGRCTLSYHGGDPMVSPFMHKSLPGYEFDVRKQDVSENVGYKLCWPMSLGTWSASEEDPSGFIIEGHHMLMKWGGDGSYGVEGSRGCMRSCFNRLEKQGTAEQTFHNGAFIKRSRWLLPCRCAPAGEAQR